MANLYPSEIRADAGIYTVYTDPRTMQLPPYFLASTHDHDDIMSVEQRAAIISYLLLYNRVQLHHPAIDDIPFPEGGTYSRYNQQVSQRLAERWAAGERINPVVAFPESNGIRRTATEEYMSRDVITLYGGTQFPSSLFGSRIIHPSVSEREAYRALGRPMPPRPTLFRFTDLEVQQYIQCVLEHGREAGRVLFFNYLAWIQSPNVNSEFELFACRQTITVDITAGMRRGPVPDEIIRHIRGFLPTTRVDMARCLRRYNKDIYYEYFKNFIRRVSGKRDDEIHWPTVHSAYEIIAANLEHQIRVKEEATRDRRSYGDDENPAKRQNVTTTKFGKPRISKRAFVNKYCKKRGCTTAYAIAKYNMCVM